MGRDVESNKGMGIQDIEPDPEILANIDLLLSMEMLAEGDDTHALLENMDELDEAHLSVKSGD